MPKKVRTVDLCRGDKLVDFEPRIVDDVLPVDDPNKLRVWWHYENGGSGSFVADINDEFWTNVVNGRIG